MGISSLIGKVGWVTGQVAPGTTGEVTLSVRGGSEAFFAHPHDGQEVIPKGIQVLVVGSAEPRTVYVTAFTGY